MAVTSERLKRVQLSAGDLVLTLVPELGGSIATFTKGGVDIMRPLSAEAEEERNVLGVASFPMIPYANRIDGNGFIFEGVTYAFLPNNPPERFNVHGTAWHSSWEVAAADTRSATLTLDRRIAGEPYLYRATQRFDLAPDGLTLDTIVENVGPLPMPFGFGHHPWFERDADATLRFAASHVWESGPDGTSGARIPVPPELDFSAGPMLPPALRNNCYSGWDGIAEITFPARGLTLRMEADPILGKIMTYADPQKPFFCAEPQSNVPCAANKLEHGEEDLGILVLAPGEPIVGAVRFIVTDG